MLGLGAPVQIAYAVPDAKVAAVEWARRYGAGPFVLQQHIQLKDVIYRGNPSQFDHSSAFGQWGEIMVELMQDHNTGPSVVRDMYAVGEAGLHHVSFMVDDLDAATERLVEAGFPVAMSEIGRAHV